MCLIAIRMAFQIHAIWTAVLLVVHVMYRAAVNLTIAIRTGFPTSARPTQMAMGLSTHAIIAPQTSMPINSIPMETPLVMFVIIARL
ncbi:MAG: hypothetical protein B6D36_19425 [Planctomycetes bacterium UTPLA1]|nr:MAG: hypothetical protein B6D36_19425 [Planctomycetes bacterium UTPLA1]